MTTTVSVGMLPIVTLPRFVPSSAAVQSAPPSSYGQAAQWAAANGDTQGGGDLDFDLLAEYLLDDATAIDSNATGSVNANGTGMPQFDFSEAASGSGFVSAEESEDGSPSPMHPAAPLSAPHFMQELQQQTMLSPAPPSMATHGMTLPIHPGIPMVPGGFPSLPTSAPAPMPSAPAMVVHHHPGPAVTISIHHPGPGPNVPISIPQNKRRRFDGPAQVFAGAQSTQVPKSNGHVVPHVMPITTSNAIPGRGRQKSQVQIDRRRERNRILARRTRLRKKFFFESLQKDVNDLQRENTVLKELVKKKFDSEAAKQLLAECNAMESLPNDVQEAVFENADLDNQDFNLVRSIQSSQQCFIITDPSLQDNPIVFASDDFLTLTGYEREEVLGRNCRFLQGTGTSVRKIEQVRKSISMGEDVSVTMINYTADGTAFWNKLFIAALRDAHNNIVNFIGVIVKVAAPEPDDPEAGRRLPGGGQPGDQTTANGEEGDIHNEDDDQDEDAAIADGTVRAMEGAVSAAVSAANGVALSSAVPATDGVAVNAAVPATDGVDLSSAVPATDGVDLS